MCRMIALWQFKGKKVSADLLVWATRAPDAKRRESLAGALGRLFSRKGGETGAFRRWRGALGDCQRGAAADVWRVPPRPLTGICRSVSDTVLDAEVPAENWSGQCSRRHGAYAPGSRGMVS